MNRALVISITTFCLSLAVNTHADNVGGDGGGGGAIVCRDSTTHAIISVELLDLWEAREVQGQTIQYDDSTSVEDQAAAAISKLESLDIPFGRWAAADLIKVKTNQKQLGDAVVVNPPSDAKSHFSPKEGCALEGMMYYDDRQDKLFVSPGIFGAQKTKTSMAASLVHEAVYKAMRDNMETPCQIYYGYDSLCPIHDSQLARTIVGCLFSQDMVACLGLDKNKIGIHLPLENKKDDEFNRYTNKSIQCSNADGSTQISANIDINQYHDVHKNPDPGLFGPVTYDNGWSTFLEIQNFFVEKLNGTKMLAGPNDEQDLRANLDGRVITSGQKIWSSDSDNPGDVMVELSAVNKLKLTLDSNNDAAISLTCKTVVSKPSPAR